MGYGAPVRRSSTALVVCLVLVLGPACHREEDGPPASAPTSSGARSPSSSMPRSTAPSPTLSPTPPNAPSPIPGYLLIADRGNDRLLLVDSGRHVLWRYPGARTPSFPFHFDDDAFFSPDHSSIITNQEDQQTLEVLSFPGGRVQWTYGHVNVRGSGPGYLSTPDDAYVLPDGTRSVADIRNCRILFLSPEKKVIRQLGRTGWCAHDPPRSFASPNGDTPLPDGGTLVTEINGSYVDDISASGKLRWSIHAPVAYPSDAQLLPDGRILLADYSMPGHVLLMNRRGRVLWRYGPDSGPGMLNHPSLALMLPNGLIAVNDDLRDRVVLIDPAKGRIVWQYGRTDLPGTAADHLHIPDGMDFLPFDVAMSTPAIRQVVLTP